MRVHITMGVRPHTDEGIHITMGVRPHTGEGAHHYGCQASHW